MDLYDKILNKEDIESIIELIKEDKKIITRLYSYETIFSKTLNYLLVNRNKNTDLEYLFTIFIDILSGSLINKPSDLLSCIQKIKNKNNQILFLKTIIHHRLVNDDFLISLGVNKFVFEHLPYDLSWIEIPVIKYGSKAIISATEKLSIVQICPLIDCIEDTSLIEYLVGWAFEEDKLNDSGIDYFMQNYEKKYNLIRNIKQKENNIIR
ncbi:conserved hypothetical protein [Bacteroidetes oral taxon 274 str. F0058]|nr:conserved hypothetical protein [Bacteroidetes oral taxon 274 str. F0058]